MGKYYYIISAKTDKTINSKTKTKNAKNSVEFKMENNARFSKWLLTNIGSIRTKVLYKYKKTIVVLYCCEERPQPRKSL